MLAKLHDRIIENLRTTMQNPNKSKLDMINIIELCKHCILQLNPQTYTEYYRLWYYNYTISTCYTELKQYKMALAYAEKLIPLWQDENALSKLRTYERLIKCNIDLKNLEKVKELQNEHIQFFESLGITDLM